MKQVLVIPYLCLLLLFPSELLAQQRVIELSDTVVGNQEQPKVMYIVPWQPPEGPEPLYRPLSMTLKDHFKRLERSEFIRSATRKEKLLAQKKLKTTTQ